MGQSAFLGQTAQGFFQRSSHSKHLTHGKTFEKQLQQVFSGVYLVYYCFPSLLPKETNRIRKKSFQSIKKPLKIHLFGKLGKKRTNHRKNIAWSQQL